MTVVHSNTFEGYADTAALLAAWNQVDAGGGVAIWTLDGTHVVSGAKAAKLALTGAAGGESYLLNFPLTGLVPGALYSFSRQIWPSGDALGLNPAEWNLFTTPKVANEAGEATLSLGVIVVAGTGVDLEWWHDDVALEDQAEEVEVADQEEAEGSIDFDDILINSGVLFLNGVGYRPSRGGWTFDPQKVIEPWPYDGDYAAVIGTDQVASMKPVLRGTLMRVGSDELALYEAGGSTDTAGGVTTRTPPLIGLSLGVGALLSNVAVRWRRKDGGYLRVRFPYGLCTRYSIGSQDKSEGEIPVEIEARAATAGSPLYYVDRYML